MKSTIQLFPRLVCLVFVAILLIAASPSSTEISVKTELQQLIDAHKMRSAVVMWFEDSLEQIGLVKLGEISDVRRELPSESSTVFELGSITKVFTALLIQTLVDDKLLEWDGTISEYLPDINFSNEAIANVTLRELATHRSGLPRLPTNFAQTATPGNPMDPYANYGEQELVSFLETAKTPELKKEYAYSNLGFGILGYIVEKTQGMSYADAMSQRVFQPLEMNNSTVFDAVEDDTELAAGYSNSANMDVWTFNIHAGAGAIRSTAQDMLKFILANFQANDDAIHRAIRSIRELQYESNHALGWITETSSQDSTVFFHSGQTGGYASFLALDPATNRGWVILTTSTESDTITKLGASFYREIGKDNSVDLSPYVGVYQLSESLYMTISDNDGKLQLQVTGQQPFMLEHSKDHMFELEALNFSATFELGEDGDATALMWVQPGTSVNAKRVDDSFGVAIREEISLDKNVLQKYVGRYKLEQPPLLGGTVLVTIKQIEDRLFVKVPGQPEFRLFPMSTTRFFYKYVDVEIEFEEDEDGTVIGLVFYQAGAHRAPRILDED